jgi:ankyrin repeat protein
MLISRTHYRYFSASQKGYTDAVKFLLEAGAKVNACNHDGDTALLWACHEGHQEVAQIRKSTPSMRL